MRRLLLAPVLALLCGCLEMEETVTVYLRPDGKAELVAFLDDIRSTESDATARAKEEKRFLVDFRRGEFGVKALRDAGGKNVRKHLVRGKAPYVVTLTASYDAVEKLFGIFDFNVESAGKTARVTGDAAGPKLVLAFAARPAGTVGTPELRDDFPLHFKLVATAGAFREPQGFLIDKTGRTAVLDGAAFLEKRKKGEPFEVSLGW